MRVSSRILLSRKITVTVAFFLLIGVFIMPATALEHFVVNGDGTVTDTKTDLMWAAKDNGIPINWPDALSSCQNFRGGGYTDWRMPTLAELVSLHDPKYKNKRGYYVTKQIDISAQSLWASDTRGFEAARFNFLYGQEYWLRQSYSGPTRALPVRNRK